MNLLHIHRVFKTLSIMTLLAMSPQTNGQSCFVSRLIFPFDAQHNHAPGIAELSDGQMIVSWYRGSGERTADDVAVYGARLKAGQSVWSDSFLMHDTPGFPDCNTAMITNAQGHLMLFWPVIIANSWESCLTHMKVSEHPGADGCPVWDKHETLLLKPEDLHMCLRKLSAIHQV